LTQVIPSTGQSIAAELKKPNFQITDLYKPYLSLEFGAYYYGKTYRFLDKDFMMALAGYNGGPGNGQKWKNADPDFSVENITLTETQTYVRRVYQHYWFYRALYGR
jgi:soluble lytic murein transglycosylase